MVLRTTKCTIFSVVIGLRSVLRKIWLNKSSLEMGSHDGEPVFRSPTDGY